MSNATLTPIAGYQAKDADLSITLNQAELEEIMLGKAKLTELAEAGRAKLDGNASVLQQLAAAYEMFDPRFQIVPGTRNRRRRSRRPRERSSRMRRLTSKHHS